MKQLQQSAQQNLIPLAADGSNGQALVTDGSGTFLADAGGASANNDLSDAVTYDSGKSIGLGNYHLPMTMAQPTTTIRLLVIKSLETNTSGEDNTAVGGSRALTANSTGEECTAIGKSALLNNMYGVRNTWVAGHRSVEDCTTGYDNTGVGDFALGNATTGYQNIAGSEVTRTSCDNHRLSKHICWVHRT